MPYPGPQPRPGIPPPPTQGNGFGAGLAQFIEAYRGEQQSKKQQAAANFDKHLALLQQGLPGVDLKKMAKWAREAGLEFDYESPAVAQPPAQQPQGGMPGGMPPQGGGQGAPPPPPPQAMQGPMPQGPPPQQRQGIFNRLGAAMGVPQPPSPSQQQGAMAMLQEIKKRGQMSRESQEAEGAIKKQLAAATQSLLSGLSAGKTLDDPEMMKWARMVTLATRGMPMQGGIDATSVLAPEQAKVLAAAKEAEEKTKQDAEINKMFAAWGLKNNLDLGQIAAVARGELDPSKLDASAIGSEREKELMLKTLPDVMALYPDAPPDVQAQFATLLVKGGDPELITALSPRLGKTLAQKRYELAEKSGARSERSVGVSERRLGMSEEEASEEQRVMALVDKAIEKHTTPEEAAKHASEFAEKPGDITRILRALRGSTPAVTNYSLTVTP